MTGRGHFYAVVSLCLFTLLATLLLQRWIGALTIYGEDVEAKRLELHSAIIANQPPVGRTWESLGARNTNTRVMAVWLAEGLHRGAGFSILKAYVLLDTAGLWISLLLLFYLLRQWFEPLHCLVGVLYYICVMPLTYLFYFFHPWDRMSQCLWIVILLCIKRGWFGGLVVTLGVSMVVKYDTVPVPAIYWLANLTRANVVPVTLRATGLLLVTLGMLIGLIALFPGGATAGPHIADAWARAVLNIESMEKMNIVYPPLLMHGMPALLAIAGWARADPVARAATAVGLLGLVPLWFVGSNFHEVRAQVPLLLLLLPSALYGLQSVLDLIAPDSRRVGSQASLPGA